MALLSVRVIYLCNVFFPDSHLCLSSSLVPNTLDCQIISLFYMDMFCLVSVLLNKLNDFHT